MRIPSKKLDSINLKGRILVMHCLAIVVFLAAFCQGSASPKPAAVESPDSAATHERLGPLFHGMTSTAVEGLLGAPQSKTSVESEGLERWNYPRKGISLDMKSSAEGLSVEEIRIVAPCPYKTNRGIGVGDAEGVVATAYAFFAKMESPIFWAGAPPNAVGFEFAKGKVKAIRLGTPSAADSGRPLTASGEL